MAIELLSQTYVEYDWDGNVIKVLPLNELSEFKKRKRKI